MPFRLPERSSKSCATIDAVESKEENSCESRECGKEESAGRIAQTNSSSGSMCCRNSLLTSNPVPGVGLEPARYF